MTSRVFEGTAFRRLIHNGRAHFFLSFVLLSSQDTLEDVVVRLAKAQDILEAVGVKLAQMQVRTQHEIVCFS